MKRFVSVNGIRLHIVEYGKGPLVVLLHGFPEHWYAWRFQLPALAESGYRVVAPDLRGYNLSDKPKGISHYRLELLVEDVKCLIHALGEEEAIVAGHDWGGVIAWQLAALEPQMVKKLIILNAPHPQRYLEELKTIRQLLRSWYVLFFQLPWVPEFCIKWSSFAGLGHRLRHEPLGDQAFDEATITAYRQALAQPGALTAALNYYRAGFRSRVAGQSLPMNAIEAPTLVIWGEQDRYLGLELLDGLELRVRDLTLERIPDVGHWVQAEAPEHVNAVMLKFLGQGRK